MAIKLEGFTKVANGGGFRTTYSVSKSVAYRCNKGAYALIISRFVPGEIWNADKLSVLYNKQRNCFAVIPDARGDFSPKAMTSPATKIISAKSLVVYIAKTFGLRKDTQGTVQLATSVASQNGQPYLLIKGIYDAAEDPFLK